MSLWGVSIGQLPLGPRFIDENDQEKRKRSLGAYFTPNKIARAICDWAIRGPRERILEPSFGGCGFLEAAASRLAALGANTPKQNLFGCDIDPSAFEYLANRIGAKAGRNFLLSDFLALRNPSSWPQAFDAVVGNPPYISYHNLSPEQRRVAKKILELAGPIITLPGSASFWAYFLVHSIRYVGEGGRLALILPRSFLDARYSRDLRQYVGSQFERSVIIFIKQQVFKHEGAEERGVDLYRVQRLLGHRDGRMTQRYAHLAPENLRDAVQVFNADYHKFSTNSVGGSQGVGLSA